LRRLVAWLIAVPVLLYAAACALLYVSQRNVMYYPVPRQAGGVPTMPLVVGDATVVVSTRPLAGPRAVLYFGGNAEDVSSTLPELALAYPAHALYALHYRGYGGSPGTPNEKDNIADALALFDRVHPRHAEVTVVGRSLGSGMAVQVAGARPVARLVLVTPYDSMAAVAATHYPYFPVRWLLHDRYESDLIAPHITAPTTILAAEHDQVIPTAHARRLFDGFRPGVARFVLLRGVDHNSFGGTPEYLDALRAAGEARAPAVPP
jgi:pimeloyl-ACP methyl ester carboxylesterase